jgi:hypothetical protein
MAHAALAQVTLQYPRRDFDALAQQSTYWIGTPNGLYQYRSAENIWSVRSTSNGLPSNTVTRLGYDDETVWIGRDRGVTKFDLKSNVMLSYDTADGLPHGAVLSMAFESDYAWVGTAHGVARYDRLIEQWQTIDTRHGLVGDAAYAIGVRDGATWIFTESAVNEYDARYERWRQYRPDSADLNARDVLLTGNAAWIVREKDLLRFDYASRVFQRYVIPEFPGFPQIRYFAIDGNSFWIVTGDALWYYDALNDSFRPFLEIANLPDREIHSIAISTSGTSIAFATRSGISQYDRGAKTWKYYNEAGGLPRSDFSAMFSAGSDLIGMTGGEFIYLSTRDNRWYNYALLSADGPGGATFSADPAHGTYADFGSGVRLSLSGTRASWLWKSDDLSTGDISSAARYDLKARLDLGGDRSISAGYNNADYADVMYGAQYRGAKDDVLQSLQIGDLRVEQGLRQFLPSFGIFGEGGRISLGARTERYHRALLEVTAAEGHRTTAVTSDFFTGKTKKKQATFRDVDYIRRQLYRLPSSWDIAAAGTAVTVFRSVAVGSALNAFIEQSTVAGVSARWERLYAGKDYVIENAGAVVQLTAPLPKGASLAARLTEASGGLVEELLAGADFSTHEIVNRYFLRGTGIIPTTLRLRLRDAAGQERYTLEFGFGWGDSDVHDFLMDFRNGILGCAMERPFPASVYSDSAVSDITFTAEFETFNTSYVLSNTGIVRGSEKILVDGVPVKAGDDYVLDYTSGYLLFTRDGAVNDDSRIEVTYEYTTHDASDRYGQVTAVCSPSDNVQVTASVAHFTSAEGRKQIAVTAAADLRAQNDLFDLRVLPEFARTISDSGSGNAYGVQSWLSAGGFRLNARTRRQETASSEKFARLFPQGRLRNESFAHSELDVLQSLRLIGEWNHRSGTDTLGNASKDERMSLGAQWVQNALPSITVKAERLTEAAGAGSSARRAIRADLEYILPADALGIASGLLTSYMRLSDASVFSAGGARTDDRFQNYYFRALISPIPSFTINTYYRGDRLDRVPSDIFSEYRDQIATEKLFFDLVLESIRGLSLNGRGTIDSRGLKRQSYFWLFDGDRRSSMQASGRLSPGAYIDALTPFTVTASVQVDRSAYHESINNGAWSWFLPLFASQGGTEIASTHSTSLEGRVEWRPTAEFVYLVTGRHTGTDASQFATTYTDTRNEVLQRIDYRLGSSGLYSGQLSWINSYNPWSHLTRLAPGVWMEQRWSPRFLTRLTLSGTLDDRMNGLIHARTRDISPGVNLTFTVPEVPVIRKFEIRDDLAYTHGVQSAETAPGIFQDLASDGITNVVYLDLYPHPTSYIRMQYQSQWRASGSSPTLFTNSGQVSVVLQL